MAGAAAALVAATAFAQAPAGMSEVSADGCKLYLPQSEAKGASRIRWSGQCANGFAEGRGVVRIYSGGRISIAAERTFAAGKMASPGESYFVKGGEVIRSRGGDQLQIAASELPTWALELSMLVDERPARAPSRPSAPPAPKAADKAAEQQKAAAAEKAKEEARKADEAKKAEAKRQVDAQRLAEAKKQEAEAKRRQADAKAAADKLATERAALEAERRRMQAETEKALAEAKAAEQRAAAAEKAANEAEAKRLQAEKDRQAAEAKAAADRTAAQEKLAAEKAAQEAERRRVDEEKARAAAEAKAAAQRKAAEEKLAADKAAADAARERADKERAAADAKAAAERAAAEAKAAADAKAKAAAAAPATVAALTPGAPAVASAPKPGMLSSPGRGFSDGAGIGASPLRGVVTFKLTADTGHEYGVATFVAGRDAADLKQNAEALAAVYERVAPLKAKLLTAAELGPTCTGPGYVVEARITYPSARNYGWFAGCMGEDLESAARKMQELETQIHRDYKASPTSFWAYQYLIVGYVDDKNFRGRDQYERVAQANMMAPGRVLVLSSPQQWAECNDIVNKDPKLKDKVGCLREAVGKLKTTLGLR